MEVPDEFECVVSTSNFVTADDGLTVNDETGKDMKGVVITKSEATSRHF
jgi:hypothetical protein